MKTLRRNDLYMHYVTKHPGLFWVLLVFRKEANESLISNANDRLQLFVVIYHLPCLTA